MAAPLKFKVGDKVIVTGYGDGKVTSVYQYPISQPYYVKLDSTGAELWFAEHQLTPQFLSIPSHYVPTPAHATPDGLDALDLGAWSFGGLSAGYVSTEEKLKRKSEGRCEECGDLLPMSIHGLGECPKHPKPLPPDFKQ